MAQLHNGYDYYKRMLDLQEKLRKSEEERIRLEERFKILVRESRNRHDACINRLRLRYVEFLEEQRARDERNHKLLGALDRVDNSLTLMTTKTERLNDLRKQYEAYFVRTYANRGPPGSITGDSGIASQNEEKWSKRNIALRQANLSSPEMKSASTSQLVPRQSEIDQTISLSMSKLNQPAQNIGYQTLDSVPLITKNDTNFQPILPRNQTISQVQDFPIIQRYHSQSAPLLRNIAYQNRSVLDSQLVRKAHVPSGMSPRTQIGQLSGERASQYNKSQSELMEPVQSQTDLVLSDPSNGTVSQYKSSNVSSHRIASPILQQQQINLSPVTQPFRYTNNRILSSNVRVPIRSNGDTGFSVGPVNSRSFNRPLSYLDDSENGRRPLRDPNTFSLTSPEVDEMIRRNEQMPKYLGVRKGSRKSSALLTHTNPVEGEDESGVNLDIELDRYMGRIKALQQECDVQSLEEIELEQNTSGDLLNVSLSEDDLDLPIEEKPKSKTSADVNKDSTLTNLHSNLKDSKTQEAIENREAPLDENIQSSSPTVKRTCELLPNLQKHETPVALAKEKLDSDIGLHDPKLDQLEDTEKCAKQDSAGVDFGLNEPIDGSQSTANENDKMRSKNDTEETSDINLHKDDIERKDDTHSADVLELELQLFTDLEAVKSFDLEELKKEIREVNLNAEDKDQSAMQNTLTDELPDNDSSTEQFEVLDLLDSTSNDRKKEECEKENVGQEEINGDVAEDRSSRLESEIAQSKKLENQSVLAKVSSDENVNEVHAIEDEKEIEKSTLLIEAQECADATEVPKDNFNEEKTNEFSNEPENDQISSVEGTKEMDNNIVQQEPQYDSNQAETYPENYTYNESGEYKNDDQAYGTYASETYPEGTGEQYAEYGGEVYDENQYNENLQYEQDPNAQYNTQDPNQEYPSNYNEEYDPNQTYEPETNQTYDYPENVPYDANATDRANLEGEDKEPVEKRDEEKIEDTEKVEEEKEKVNIEEKEDPVEIQESIEPKKKKDVIRSLLDSDTDSTIERNVSNTESDFDFN